MCRPLVTLTPEDDTVTTAWPRARCTPLIASLLQRSCRYEALVREETFTALARKLERMLLKAYPLDIAVVSEDELRWRLRHIVRRLLKSKDCVALQPNNYAAS
ncbi:hypothetical protein SPRG_18865 [Saprolegnia parasitica CBS 223.65]|uniref:Uncharacterized protein n=1 Tax=Saprolegnia parasitica (strain CBS 223.65) TaxID=695850 RepID=A0A067D9Q7_SAPPC|nr:hypothetical protein SPRG_18865 [Saprolegnia parasitica CBS 223.65]KDO35717.1 hypothetical protein SPRG_18865 [Saprolegnia parasitica CBS 223.65]|eukprot:XP_012194081.1 hypothetical protein SPRG_18865 [Saprolegnia parasitica CBS 223.65]